MTAIAHKLAVWAVTFEPDCGVIESTQTLMCDHEPGFLQVWWECSKDHPDDDTMYDTDGWAHGVKHQRLNGVWMTEGTQCCAQAMESNVDEVVRESRLRPGIYDVDLEVEDDYVWVLLDPAVKGIPNGRRMPHRGDGPVDGVRPVQAAL